MTLQFKPDLEPALERWRAFWHQDLIRRPCVSVTAPLDDRPLPAPFHQFRPDSDFDRILDRAEDAMAATYYGGEAMPFFQPSFGPDQLAAFVGARLNTAPESAETTWSDPFVDDWSAVLPLRLGHGNDAWRRMIELYRNAGERGRDRYLVGMLDLHSNFDWLAAIRGPDRLCMDIIDQPAMVHRAMDNVRVLYPQVYRELYAAAGMAGRGTCGWLPYFSEHRFATTQCDFCLLLSPAHFREFVLPALEAESRFLDHSVYHYDGPGALVHFDDITGMAALDGIQWTPGAGEKPMVEWVDLLRRFQDAGKNVFVSGSPDEIKFFHRALKPNRVFYAARAQNRREADALLAWLETHT